MQGYDSTKNFLADQVEKYIGQELYVVPQSEEFKAYGYRDFLIDYTKPFPDEITNIYKPAKNSTSYEAVAGKYYKVLHVYRHPQAAHDYYLAHKFFLELQSTQDQQILYYEYDPNYESTFPFLVMGYFEKMKKNKVGKSFIIRGTNWWHQDQAITDIYTGEQITLLPGDKWRCIDLIIEKKYFTCEYILENENNKHIPIRIQDMEGNEFVFEASQAVDYKNKFGEENWNRILKGVVKVGWDKEMCRLSWGAPKKINETNISGESWEQWIYPDENLYFDNGKLRVIQ